GPFARRARHLDVGHEVQLRGDRPLSLAFLAAAPLDVETEAAGPVLALDRERRFGEEIANRVVEADVGRGIRTAVPADGRLIDADHLAHVFDALDRREFARQRARVDEALP